MNVVLYTHQLEPITVFDIPEGLWRRLESGECVSIAVAEPPTMAKLDDPLIPHMRRIDIVGERIRRRGHETLMLFTGDEESALLLKSEFLPGQRRELQEREYKAFGRGFLKAITEFGL